MRHFRPLTLFLLLGLTCPLPARGQLIFDWPIRSGPQPESLLTGAEAVFWNPGNLAEAAGTMEELWVTHIDGPDETGVRGLALAGVFHLPVGFRAAAGYWHLGIPDIPITTDSPAQEMGTLEVAEDVAILGLARNGMGGVGLGGALRFQRGSAGGEHLTEMDGSLGMSITPRIPFSPRLGLALTGLAQSPRILAGLELGSRRLARGRIPIHLAYGIQRERGGKVTDHRVSLRGSWMERIHLGMGLSHWGEKEGWTPLWSLGVELGRYSFAILRENLSNGFGPVHFYRGAIRFPPSGTR